MALIGAVGGPMVGCGDHPSGALSLRGGDGRWYDLEFTDCAGCGVDITAMGAEILQRVDPL